MFPDEIEVLARDVLDRARMRELKLATAESCTGGLVAGALTAIAGSSDVFEGGLVTYSNPSKSRLVGVTPGLLARYGAVSEPVARAMAEGALIALGADLAVAITGVAGPGGGTPEKPVGLVHFASAAAGAQTRAKALRLGDIGRDAVRLASVRTALQMLQERLKDEH